MSDIRRVLCLPLFCAVLACSARGPIRAQEAERLRALSSSASLSIGEAAWLALAASAALDPSSSDAAALESAVERGWLPRSAPPGPVDESGPSRPATLGQLSFLAMKAFALKGGIGYSLFPSPRRAFRELLARGALPPASDPDDRVSGAFALYLVTSLRSPGAPPR